MNQNNIQAVVYAHRGTRPCHEDNFLFEGNFISSLEQDELLADKIFYFGTSLQLCQSGVRIYAVSDGMGGHNAGEVASHICVSKLASLEPSIQNSTDINDVIFLCQKMIADINREVCHLSDTNVSLKGMGATLVLLIFCEKKCAVLNIGDSRAYVFNGLILKQITKDNTEGQRMLDLKLLTYEEIKKFPARKNLNRYIGLNSNNFVLTADEYIMNMQEGIYVLCSDGVSDLMTYDEITHLLCNEQDIKTAGKKIIDRVVSADQADNATVMLISTRR